MAGRQCRYHAAYDADIFGISPEYRLGVRPDLLAESDGPTLRYALQAIGQSSLKLPRSERLDRINGSSPDDGRSFSPLHDGHSCISASWAQLDVRSGSTTRGFVISDVNGSDPNESSPLPHPGGIVPVPWLRLKPAEQFWYILHCIYFGAGYLAKVPTKRALADAGLGQTTSAEKFWYVLECLFFGAGYLAKVSVNRALRDAGLAQSTGAEQFWYILLCIYFGVGYFAKVPMKKALSDTGLSHMTDAEQFWYVLECLYFGAGYFAKVFHKKALSELAERPTA